SPPTVRALVTPSQRSSPVGAPAKASEVTVKPVRSAAALVGWITPSSFRSSGGPVAGKGGTRWAAAPAADARSATTAMEKRAMKPAYPRDRGAQSGASRGWRGAHRRGIRVGRVWRGDRVVEGARLLSVCRGSTPTEGSNPSLSAEIPALIRALARRGWKGSG